MVTVSVIAGSEVRPIRIVPATSKSMVSAPGCVVGRDDRLAERARSGIMEVRHRECGQEFAAFQDLDPPHS